MRLRRGREALIDMSVDSPTWAAAWDGVPMAPAPGVVIQAARAGDLVAHAEHAQLV